MGVSRGFRAVFSGVSRGMFHLTPTKSLKLLAGDLKTDNLSSWESAGSHPGGAASWIRGQYSQSLGYLDLDLVTWTWTYSLGYLDFSHLGLDHFSGKPKVGFSFWPISMGSGYMPVVSCRGPGG